MGVAHLLVITCTRATSRAHPARGCAIERDDGRDRGHRRERLTGIRHGVQDIASISMLIVVRAGSY